MSRFISVIIGLAICISATVSAGGTTYSSRLLDAGGWNYTWAMDINNSGQIVGSVQSDTTSNAVIWNNYAASPQLINTGETDRGSLGYKINNSGVVTGNRCTSAGSVLQFQWTAANGIASELSYPYNGNIKGAINAVNDANYVVGYSVSESNPENMHATLWYDDNTVDIGTFGGTWSSAEAINNANVVAGYYGGDSGGIGNFLWSLNGETTFIPACSLFDSGGLFSIADINDSGVVLGNTQINGVYTIITWSASEGYTIVGSGIAYAINNSNTIVGTTDIDFCQSVVWTPEVPEPTGIITLLVGILPIAAGLRLRRKRN